MHTNPEVLALLALGEEVGSPQDRDHIASCPVCANEVQELSHLAGVGRSSVEVMPLQEPSPQVWERIRAELGFVNGMPVADAQVPAEHHADVISLDDHPRRAADQSRPDDVADPGGSTTSRSTTGRGRRIISLAVAAVLALIVGVGVGLGWDRLNQPVPTVVADTALTSVAPTWDGSTGEATLERDPTGNRILVVRMSASKPVPGTSQVWLITPEITAMRNLGTMTGSEGRFAVPSDVDIARFPVVDVSAEPPGDPDVRHSGDSIVRGTLAI